MEHIESQGEQVKTPDSIKHEAGYAVAKNIVYGVEMEIAGVGTFENNGRAYPVTSPASAMRAVAQLYVKKAQEAYERTLR